MDVPDGCTDASVVVLSRRQRDASPSPSVGRRRRRAAAPPASFRSSGWAAQRQSPAPQLPAFDSVRTAPAQQPRSPTAPSRSFKPPEEHRAAPGQLRPSTQGVVIQPCRGPHRTSKPVLGRILLNGAPVAGARVVVDGYTVPRATAANGTFPLASTSFAQRRRARERSRACTVHGHALSAVSRARSRQRPAASASAGFHGLTEHLQKDGSVVAGRVTDCRGRAACVHLLTPSSVDDHGRVGQAGSGRGGDYAHPGP